MECTLDVSFSSEQSHWLTSLPKSPTVSDWNRQVKQWWQFFAELDAEKWRRLLSSCMRDQEALARVIDGERAGARIRVLLSNGSEGVLLAPELARFLQLAGCAGVEVILITDEAEVVIDSEGNSHFMGERYFFDEGGSLCVAEYPEIEYVEK